MNAIISSCALNLFCTVLLAGLYFVTRHITKKTGSKISPLIGAIVAAFGVYLILRSVLTAGTEVFAEPAKYILGSVCYVALAVVPALWFWHCCREMKLYISDLVPIMATMMIPAAVVACIAAADILYKKLFTVNAAGELLRGSMYGFFVLIGFGYLAASLIITFVFSFISKKEDKKQKAVIMTVTAALMILFGAVEVLSVSGVGVVFFTVGIIIYFAYLITCGMSAQQDILRSQMSIVKTMTEDFECVDCVSVYKDKLSDITTPYRESRTFSEKVPGWNEEKNYSKRLGLICTHVVYGPDRKSFYAQTRREAILSALRENAAYFVNFRSKINGNIEYLQLKFTVIREPDGSIKNLIAGIHSIDAEMKKQNESQIFLEWLASDYSCVSSIDCTSGEEKYYALDDAMFSSNIDGWDNVKDFSKRRGLIAEKLIADEDKTEFMEMTSNESVLKKISENRPYYVKFKIVTGDGTSLWQLKFFESHNFENRIIAAFQCIDGRE